MTLDSNKYLKTGQNSLYSNLLVHLVFIGLLLNLIFPTFSIGIGVNIITPVSLLIFLLIMLNKKVILNKYILIYFMFCFSIFISMNYGYLFLSVDNTYRDYMELFRVAQYIPYLFAIKYLDYFVFKKKLKIYGIICTYYLLFICFLQITNISDVASLLGSIYSNPNHTYAMVSASKRIIATTSNPNDGALVLSFFLYLNLIVLDLNRRHRFFVCFFLFLAILYTQSRTIMVGFSFSFLVYFIFYLKVKYIIKLTVSVFLSVLLIIILYQINLDYVFVGFEMATKGENQSLNVRLVNIHQAYQRFSESIMFGFGPAKSIFKTTVDSEYAMVLQRYGIFGLFSMLIYYYFVFSGSRFNKNEHIFQRNIKIFSIIIILLSFFVMLTNNFFSGYQTGSIPVLVLILLSIKPNFSTTRFRSFSA